ncbi:polyprenyl synthetase family protein [Polymorphobacter fuscus]|uniref:Polyprenyl synthetase family protein n=2 Tax=Sandarakinorhabdus fusca TaxID=1439888 RepID=A0A7C9GW69_9SPHN|nr:polyprenyl synthetase family protein [Polymorphobacter fuscus]MQT18018.1 polyprenyl synthetase family protein [Polymorphobacter fuscus]
MAAQPGPARQTPDIVPALLREYGAATRARVDHYLAASAKAPYLGDLVTDYPRRRGKMMRPSICIAAACAHGARLADVVGSAAAIEIFHNALLVHDDIEDGSEVRRGAPTLHVAHGVPLAINAGDAMIVMALQPLIDNVRDHGAAVAWQVLAATQQMARETAEGQALELGWRDCNRVDLTQADYFEMVLKKTAWMSTIWPARIGVLIGAGGFEAHGAAVTRFGFFLGAAFQIQDDLLNLVADAAYGKEANGDLFEGKRTLVLIHARTVADDADRRAIDAFLALARADRTPAMVEEIAGVIARTGSIDHVREVAVALAGAASHEFDRAFGHLPPSRDRDFLEGLVPWVFERT